MTSIAKNFPFNMRTAFESLAADGRSRLLTSTFKTVQGQRHEAHFAGICVVRVQNGTD